MKLAIVGSRDFNDYELLKSEIDKLRTAHTITHIVSGGARGADTLAKRYAKENNIELVEHLANWNLYGKSAGYKRNVLIWQDSDMLIAFWDGQSKGTKQSIDNYKKPLTVIRP